MKKEKELQGLIGKEKIVLMDFDDSWKDNEELALKYLSISKEVYFQISKRLKDDKNFIMKAVEISPTIYQLLPKHYRDDVDIERKVLSLNPSMLIYVKRDNWTKDKILTTLEDEDDSTILSSDHVMVKSILDDKKIMEELLEKKPGAYFFLSERLKRDEDLAIIAVNGFRTNLKLVPEDLKICRKFLYGIKDIILENKDFFQSEFELLKNFEREDNLKNKFEKSDNNSIEKKSIKKNKI